MIESYISYLLLTLGYDYFYYCEQDGSEEQGPGTVSQVMHLTYSIISYHIFSIFLLVSSLFLSFFLLYFYSSFLHFLIIILCLTRIRYSYSAPLISSFLSSPFLSSAPLFLLCCFSSSLLTCPILITPVQSSIDSEKGVEMDLWGVGPEGSTEAAAPHSTTHELEQGVCVDCDKTNKK